MKQLKVKLTIVVLLLVQVLTAWAAGKPVFEVSTPLTVAVGEAFRVEFALNAKPERHDVEERELHLYLCAAPEVGR